MKTLTKWICVWMLLQSLVLSAAAQDISRWSFFIKAGYSTSNMGGQDALNYVVVDGLQYNNENINYINYGAGGQKLRIGWNGGLGADFKLNSRIFVQVELNLEAKGGVVQINYYNPPYCGYDGFVTQGKSVYALNYLTVPLLFKYYLGKQRRIFWEAGLYYGYMVGGAENGSFYPGVSKVKYSNHIEDNYTRNDLGYAFGLGYEHPQRLLNLNGQIFLDLRFERSLVKIGSVASYNGGSIIYNQSLSISVGYRVPL